jgi:uncharacterized protein (DUF1778 family)
MDETPIEHKFETEHDATPVLADRYHFTLDETAFAALVAALDRPPSENPLLAKLIHTTAPWD